MPSAIAMALNEGCNADGCRQSQVVQTPGTALIAHNSCQLAEEVGTAHREANSRVGWRFAREPFIAFTTRDEGPTTIRRSHDDTEVARPTLRRGIHNDWMGFTTPSAVLPVEYQFLRWRVIRTTWHDAAADTADGQTGKWEVR